jgi:hypothetical protein
LFIATAGEWVREEAGIDDIDTLRGVPGGRGDPVVVRIDPVCDSEADGRNDTLPLGDCAAGDGTFGDWILRGVRPLADGNANGDEARGGDEVLAGDPIP